MKVIRNWKYKTMNLILSTGVECHESHQELKIQDNESYTEIYYKISNYSNSPLTRSYLCNENLAFYEGWPLLWWIIQQYFTTSVQPKSGLNLFRSERIVVHVFIFKIVCNLCFTVYFYLKSFEKTIYKETCLNWASLGPTFVFRIDRRKPIFNSQS